MDYQTTLNGHTPADGATPNLARQLAAVGYDVVTLAELQVQLLTIDLRAMRGAVLRGLALGAVAAVMILAALPVALMALGSWLAEITGWPVSLAMFGVAAVTLVAAIGAAWIGRHEIRTYNLALRRSAEELRANFTAVKEILAEHSRREQF